MPLFHDPSFCPFLRTLFRGHLMPPFNAPGKRGGRGLFQGAFSVGHSLATTAVAAQSPLPIPPSLGEKDWNCGRATAGQAGPWPGRGWASARYSW